jgi:predicted permease
MRSQAPVAVIGHGFWQRQFGGSASVIGGPLQVEGVPFTIVGVAPRGFKGFGLMGESDVTVPLTARAPRNYTQAGLLWLQVAGGLRSGVSLEQARAQLDAVWPAIKADIIPPTHAGVQRENFLRLPLRLDSLATGYEPYLHGFRKPLFTLQGLALVALMIGCLNLASLTLRRLAGRANDRAVRIALGASSWQAVRQVVVEGVLVAVAGVFCALPFGLWASALLTQMMLPDGLVPVSVNTDPDARVFAFTAALTVIACVLFGWLPAWRSTRHDPCGPLRHHARSVTGSGRLLRLVVVTQLSLSVILLTNAGLLLRSLQRVLTADLGFESDDVVRAMFTTRPGITERPDDESYYPTLIQRVKAMSGVANVSIALMGPGNPGFREMVSPMRWEATDGIAAVFNSVTPGFFETLDIRIVAGRDFSWTDHARAPRVAILSRALAERLFPDGAPLGQRIRIGTQPYRQDVEVIGIVADARLYDAKDELSYAAYIAELQNTPPTAGGSLIIRGRVAESALQNAVQSVGPDFVRHMDQLTNAFAEAVTMDRMTALLAGIFAAATLLLAAIGVGGLFAYTVVIRTKEIAIRLALGGEPRRIVNSIVREGLLIALLSTAVGTSISVVATRPIRPLLFGIAADDPVVIIGVPFLLTTVAVCASLIPAVRAARTDPTIGLKVE